MTEHDKHVRELLFNPETLAAVEDGQVVLGASQELEAGLSPIDLAQLQNAGRYQSCDRLPPYHEAARNLLPSGKAHAELPWQKLESRTSFVLQIVGSRGDVAPFIAVGKVLQGRGHRVRLATHERFRTMVVDAGLSFFPLGADPEVLLSFVVRNGGLLPSLPSLVGGDIQKNREQIRQTISGAWDSCIQADPSTQEPFYANVVVANPPSFGSPHCAERLGVPFHILSP